MSELFGREDGPELVSLPKGVQIVPIGDMCKVPEGEAQDGIASLVAVIREIVVDELAKMKEHLVQDIVQQIRMSTGTRRK